jgi:hypothetical protein
MSRHQHFADSLTDARGQLTELWTTSVRQDPRITSDGRLTESELIDHIPRMIDEVVELLLESATPSINDAREARIHVYLRLRQGYRARDVVRELSLLRLVLLDYLAAVPGQRPGITVEDHAAAMRIINLYLDEELRYAISIYTEADSDAAESTSK